MVAVFNTATPCSWAPVLGDLPWCLLPVANRPLLDYWLETCAEQGIGAVQIVLGDGAKQVEDFAGDGKRWNVSIQYGFARPGEGPLDYLRSISKLWADGMFYLGGPFFMRRRHAYAPDIFRRLEACRCGDGNDTRLLFGWTGQDLRALIDGAPGSARGLEHIHIQSVTIGSLADYFDLNMKMVAGEFVRYATAGFSGSDGSSIGYNVRTPPSSELRAPILVGDDCRFGPMTTIGPNAVIAKHVIVDGHSELMECLVLPDTYIGRNLEIRQKIVAGNRLIDPADGTLIEIEDSWLVAKNRPAMRTEDFVRYFILWFVALGLVSLQLVPFLVLYPLTRLRRIAEFRREVFHDPRTGYIDLPVLHKLKNQKCLVFSAFKALSLDRLPWLLLVLRGKLFLCGQPAMRHPEDDEIIRQLPHYYPGVFCYQDYNKDSDRLVDSLWYAHIRSLYEDLKILVKALVSRFLRAGR